MGRCVVDGRSSVGLPEVEDRGVSLLTPLVDKVFRFPVVRRRLGVSQDISLGIEGMVGNNKCS